MRFPASSAGHVLPRNGDADGFLPTLARLAGATTNFPKPIDGKDITDLMLAQAGREIAARIGFFITSGNKLHACEAACGSEGADVRSPRNTRATASLKTRDGIPGLYDLRTIRRAEDVIAQHLDVPSGLQEMVESPAKISAIHIAT